MTQPYHVGDRIINAIPPALPVTAVKTYQIAAPTPTHFRVATCAEVECPNYLYGWVSDIDETTVEGQQWAHLIRKVAGRSYTETRLDNGKTRFQFPAGQHCFQAADHRLRLDRAELYVVRDGDFRGNPTGRVQRLTSTQWTDDFGEHQERLADKMKEG